MRLILLSDLHGNLQAWEAFCAFLDRLPAAERSIVFLGDLVDYGMYSNEVARAYAALPYPRLCEIRGNHEEAILTGDFSRFSSRRGQECAAYTRNVLTEEVKATLSALAAGPFAFSLGDKKALAVHGSLDDPYWGAIRPGQDPAAYAAYRDYDYVFSGHSHKPHFFEVFFPTDDPAHRNQKKTVFLNPGSLGQPRNLNPAAQFALLDSDTGALAMIDLPYDIAGAQAAYTGQVDDFYKTRLEYGI